MTETESEFWRRLSSAARTALHESGATTIADIVLRFPLRYENWDALEKVAQLRAGNRALVEGVVADVQIVQWRGGRRQLLAMLQDDDGDQMRMRFFNVTAGLERAIIVGARLRAMGPVKFERGWEMAHPRIQFSNNIPDSGGKLQAVYSALGGVPQERQRRLAARALATAPWQETVPKKFRKFPGGETSAQACLELIHSPPQDPETAAQLESGEHIAWKRLRFDELVAHQILLQARKQRRARLQAPPIKMRKGWDTVLRKHLPFKLTAAQDRAVAEVIADLRLETPMRRLLQGDVGTGKTIVAAAACLAAAKADKTAALMAPTEILARQHYDTLTQYFEPYNIQCELVSGAVRGSKRRDAMARLRLGVSRVVVGTHALFYEEEQMPPVALAVIDEQHRFGVEQRRALCARGTPHRLMMTATPIPRTLAMSAFADMDISVLDEAPPGRKKTVTAAVGLRRRDEVLERIGNQKVGSAYWICPRVQETYADDLQDVMTLLEKVREKYPHLGAEVLHGRMEPRDKQEVIDKFRSGRSRFLAATTVVEVGLDVPQADIIVVERAERMGLSQMHQLRGRVGRGGREGACVLLFAEDNLSEEAKTRLQTMRETDDGFKVAEADLRLRGPGEWLGTRQSGIPPFRVAKVGEDPELVAAAGEAARWMLDNNRPGCVVHIRRWLGGGRRKKKTED